MSEILFGVVLKHFRKQRGWTQAQLGKACGLTAHYIHLLETGKRPPPSRRSILLMAIALELTVQDVWQLATAAGLMPNDIGDLVDSLMDTDNPAGLYAGMARHLLNAGDLATVLRDHDQAVRCFRDALIAAQRAPDRRLETDIRAKLGHVHRVTGTYASAQKEYFESRLLARELKDESREAAALRGLGLVYKDEGRWDEAEEYQKKALELARRNGDPRGEGMALNNLGWLYVLEGRLTEANEYLQADLKISLEMGDLTGAGITLMNLGNYFQEKYKKDGDRDSLFVGRAKYQEALDLLSRGQDVLNETKCRSNLSALYLLLADGESVPVQRRRYMEQALEYGQEAYQTAHDRKISAQLEGEAQLNVAEAYGRLGEPRLAEDSFERSRIIFHSIGDLRGEIESLLSFVQHQRRLEQPRRTDVLAALISLRELIPRVGNQPAREAFARRLEDLTNDLSAEEAQELHSAQLNLPSTSP